MRKWHINKAAQCILAMLFLLSVVVLGKRVLWPDEMVCKGKPITEWMEETFWGDLPGTSMSNAEWTEAADAVDKAGTNIIPYALKLAWTQDSAFKRAVLKSSWPRKTFNLFGLSKRYDRWAQASSVNPLIATEALRFLGPRAKPAIPELLRLLRTSNNPNGRAAAARMLSRIGRDAQSALPELIEGFKDPKVPVREAVAEAVGIIESIEAPGVPDDSAMAEYRRYQEHSVDLMVPVVLKLLTDPSADADRLIGALQYFSFNEGWAATPGLLQLMDSPDSQVRARATNALKRINPSALKQAQKAR
jgi:HEAT repeat protein